MGTKLAPTQQAYDLMANAIKDSKRRFEAQNKRFGILDYMNEARFAMEAIRKNDLLLKCDVETIKDSMVHLAAMGLSLNPSSQQAALIPRWNSKKGMMDCTASPMFRGLMKLATDTGLVNNITAEVVFQCEEDTFDVDLGSKPYLVHKPKLFAGSEERVIDLVDSSRNRVIGAYCVAHLAKSEHPHITVMDIEEILNVARASDAFAPRQKKGGGPERKPSGPWVYWPGEMIKKAVIRRASKQWPLSDDSAYQRLLEAIRIDNQAEANEQRPEVRSEVVAADLGATIDGDQVKVLKDLCEQQELPEEKVYENYAVKSLSQLPLKYYDEVHEKLLDRLRRFNEARKPEAEE